MDTLSFLLLPNFAEEKLMSLLSIQEPHYVKKLKQRLVRLLHYQLVIWPWCIQEHLSKSLSVMHT